MDETSRSTAIKSHISPALIPWLKKGSPWVNAMAARAVWSLAVGPDGAVSLRNAGVVPDLSLLVLHGDDETQEKAAGALWNLASAMGGGGRIASDAWRSLEVSSMLEANGVNPGDAAAVRAVANRKVAARAMAKAHQAYPGRNVSV